MAGRWRHAHNDFAQFFAEWGIIGCVIVFGTLLCPLISLLRSMVSVLSGSDHAKTSMQRSLGLFFFVIAMTCLLMHSLIDFPMQIMASQFQFVVLAGMAFALSLPPHRLAAAAYQIETIDKHSRSRRSNVMPAYFLSGR
jgi:O-antigen ligase